MNNKRLIIGKNSKIVNKIKDSLENIDLISHNQISITNFDIYEYIYIFSWSHKSLHENIMIINQLPNNKIIFISTVAVLSNFKRDQWNKYPVHKKKIEELVIKKNGCIVRLGIFEDLINLHNHPVIPYTSYKKLKKFIEKKNYETGIIYDCFELYETKKKLKLFESFLYNQSLIFSKIKIFRIVTEFISKFILKTLYYGYTADTLNFFTENLQIGFGAIGSAHKKYSNNRLVITSNLKDKIIDTDGFNNTYVGFNKIGLSKFWHGVSTEKVKGNYIKKVPLLVKRKKIPKLSINAHVEKLNFKNNFFLLHCKNKKNKFRVYGLRVIFAAGIFENIRLLRFISENKKGLIILNDHEWFNLGTIELDEALQKKIIGRFGNFIFRKNLIYKKYKNINYLIEIRPYSKIHLNNESFKFYSNTDHNILIKLLKNFSFDRINEAFFNKFGFSFLSKKLILTSLINNKNSIRHYADKITKERLSKEVLVNIRKIASQDFRSFRSLNEYKTFDAQHINGGEELLNDDKIKELIKLKKIYIAGFPAKIDGDDFYPTHKFIKIEEAYNF